ncbi:TPA: MchS3 family protein, partial [Escherichia coli]
SIGMNGFIGYQSEGEKLYTHILTLDNPEEIFKNIIKNRMSTKESKIYAACGLYYLNVENIESLFTENDKQEYVSVLRGDILTKIKLNDILNSVIINGCNTKLISEHK